MSGTYDVIVIGLGGIGSATAYHLAQRGQSVLGLDMHQRGHLFGSSHGAHRIIREAYFEAPDYVPIVQHAYELWQQLEQESGDSNLLQFTGGLMFGPPDSQIVAGALKSAELHKLPAEKLTADEVTRRFPGFALDDDMVGVYEPRAGFVHPERSTSAHLDLARSQGAELHFTEEVNSWEIDGDGVVVTTATATYRADQLVLTTGPWAVELLDDLNLPLKVWRIVNAHFNPTRPNQFDAEHSPIFICDVPEGWYYGFPYLPDVGLKIGRHEIGEETTARTIRREVDQAEIELLQDVLDHYLPGASGPMIHSLTCMYTMTPDEHFIVDRHPEHDQVVIGCGFSGHGYKFASALGEILSDLALGQDPAFDIDFLSASRFND